MIDSVGCPVGSTISPTGDQCLMTTPVLPGAAGTGGAGEQTCACPSGTSADSAGVCRLSGAGPQILSDPAEVVCPPGSVADEGLTARAGGLTTCVSEQVQFRTTGVRPGAYLPCEAFEYMLAEDIVLGKTLISAM